MMHGFRFLINPVMRIMFVVAVFMTALNETGAEPQIVHPFESGSEYTATNNIDILVM